MTGRKPLCRFGFVKRQNLSDVCNGNGWIRIPKPQVVRSSRAGGTTSGTRSINGRVLAFLLQMSFRMLFAFLDDFAQRCKRGQGIPLFRVFGFVGAKTRKRVKSTALPRAKKATSTVNRVYHVNVRQWKN